MACIKIRSFRNSDNQLISATSKFFFRDGNEYVRNGTRWLEPEEIVELPDEEVRQLLVNCSGVIEITMEPANRPISFGSVVEAEATSMFAPKLPGRAEKAREEMDLVKEQMAEEAAKAAEEEREKIREEEREKIRAEIRAEEEAKIRGEVVEPNSEGGAGPEGEPSGHALPAEMAQGEVTEEAETEAVAEPQPAARRRRRGG